MEITYTSIGDYLIPDVVLRETEVEVNADLGVCIHVGAYTPLGVYGTLHKEYLRREKPIRYSSLLLSERLYPLCSKIDIAAKHMLATIEDRNIAHEIILAELVYT
ncbi:MAG: TnpV protein [Oscillospiraceae bacterium]|nr:TnpV protein [Oscillospiraceae bacterium]MCL2279576.1 TnpV protein [Oscillospiraceae bacterium]